MSFRDRANEAIRAAGGRMTEQRQTIIAQLAGLQERIDAETLHQQAQLIDPQINLATVYRTLEVLETAQLIRSQYIAPDHQRKYFTLAQEPYHFTCQRCHRVLAFDSDLIEHLKQQLKTNLQVQVFNVCVCVAGICPDCQAHSPKDNTA